MTDRPQHLALIGAGRVAREHARAIGELGGRLESVCDVNKEQADRFAREFNAKRSTTDVEDLFSDDSIRGVVIALPTTLHRQYAIRALEAGKHVLIEKPMALTLADCDAIISAERRADRLVQLGFVCRYAPKVAAVEELMASGVLGEIYHVRATMLRQRGIPGLGRWFTTRSQSGGGVLIDIGVHLIDLVMHLTQRQGAARVSGICQSRFGAPIEAYRYEEMWAGPPDPNGVFDVEDAATALVRFDESLALELNVAWASNQPADLMPDGITLLGTRGGCFFDLWSPQLIVTTERDGKVIDEAQPVEHEDPWNEAWRGQHRAFSHLLQTGAPPESGAQAGRNVQAIVEAIYRSSAAGREVDVG